jgi:hypothetical protein
MITSDDYFRRFLKQAARRYVKWSDRFEELENENKKLRKALQLIVDSGPASPGDKKHEIAKAALEDKYESA